MSEKKNGVSPFTDKDYLQSSSSVNNKYKKQVTEKDIDEFEKVFADDEPETKGTDGKGFFASFKTAKDKSAQAPVTPKKETAKTVSLKSIFIFRLVSCKRASNFSQHSLR